MLAACYLLTLAPGVTFWDAGEFIAAANGLGIPHPPGTPLYVALGRSWTLLLAPVAGAARAMNLLSAGATALAGALTAWLIAHESRAHGDTALLAAHDSRAHGDTAWGAITGALCAGLMATAWANATETEVYAISLLHVAVLLACAARAGDQEGRGARRWLLCTAYLVALAPAVHLSALVGVPAAIVLAARRANGGWRVSRVLMLGGTLIISAGVGRVSPWLVLVGGAVLVASALAARAAGDTIDETPWRRAAFSIGAPLALSLLAASALLIMLVRARHDPVLNQGDPATLGALAAVVGRRQYDVASLLPRQAPVWLQLANVVQYVDWQIAIDWGRGIFTTPARVLATVAFGALGVGGLRAMRRDAPRLAVGLAVLLLSGTLGVAAYLNLKAGSSLGWGVLPDSAPHEARERDYFFVLGFWAWGCFAGYGALALMRARRWPAPAALAVVLVPLLGNWRASDRSRAPMASAAHDVATALLESTPPRGVLFTAGDNDSYPLWYAQQVEGVRLDVTVITVSLLPAAWYQAELTRRTGLRWVEEPLGGAPWQLELIAQRLARAARRAGRPVVASPALTARERALLGGGWRLEGVVYRSRTERDWDVELSGIDTALAAVWARRAPAYPHAGQRPVDGVVATMLALLACPRLGQRWEGVPAYHDSLEVKCNVR